MPSKFVVRNLRENTYYHVYNRGVEGKNIFQDAHDYETFLYYLYIYTAAPIKVQKKYPDLPRRLKARNLSGEIYLIAYALLPDHFHIILKQTSADAMPRLLKQIINGYVTYFNKKYKRHGSPFQGRYKSMRIESEYLLVQMVRFVHLNPSIHGGNRDFKTYPWSSYVSRGFTEGVINRFENVAEWEKFHSDKASYEQNFVKIKNLTIE